MPRVASAALCTALLLLAVGDACAELYRYTDERGVMVLDRQGVPPQHVGRGYQVLNEQGRVIQVVPPAPTAAQRQRLLEQQQRAAADARLLRLYASVEDVERASKRKLAELESLIGIVRGNLQALRKQQAGLRQQAASHERAGRGVPDNLLTQIANLEQEEAGLQRDLQRHEASRREAEAAFGEERRRIAELLGER
ncbi:DUF4124 domain-containing protein [Pseudomonas oligotrophica]|uniref:DUF4124 domain-containing protein n=1 Tax=Pseudomonas oligotrophica TaxID=2912055 RepID=UPI001F41ED2E|nr:DUF4124 domain-containing protein [Pseudomonas oligotrophica]MCF7201404.1 DUF4124 domain-containing protein [Pseudomonas oligotrophica]